jgi:endonuclease/exonuclease/phosphatase (EEP) superfamily protein YafD
VVRRIAVAAVSLGVVGYVACLVLSLVPVFPCTLLEHFHVQLAVGGIVMVSAAAALRLGSYLDAAALALLVELVLVTPDLTASRRPVPAGTALRVLLLNVHTESTAFAEVRALIADTHPDMVALVEVSERWIAELEPALTAYPGRLESARDDNFGIALYARAPLTGTVEELGLGMPSIVAATGGINVIVTHPLPPMNSHALALQRDQFAAVAARAAVLADPVIVLGDFNATPWSRAFRRLLAGSGLCDTRDGFGLQASYPAWSAVMRIPIDHVLVSCSVGVVDRTIERDVGSDHLPVVLDLVVPGS